MELPTCPNCEIEVWPELYEYKHLGFCRKCAKEYKHQLKDNWNILIQGLITQAKGDNNGR